MKLYTVYLSVLYMLMWNNSCVFKLTKPVPVVFEGIVYAGLGGNRRTQCEGH